MSGKGQQGIVLLLMSRECNWFISLRDVLRKQVALNYRGFEGICIDFKSNYYPEVFQQKCQKYNIVLHGIPTAQKPDTSERGPGPLQRDAKTKEVRQRCCAIALARLYICHRPVRQPLRGGAHLPISTRLQSQEFENFQQGVLRLSLGTLG